MQLARLGGFVDGARLVGAEHDERVELAGRSEAERRLATFRALTLGATPSRANKACALASTTPSASPNETGRPWSCLMSSMPARAITTMGSTASRADQRRLGAQVGRLGIGGQHVDGGDGEVAAVAVDEPGDRVGRGLAGPGARLQPGALGGVDEFGRHAQRGRVLGVDQHDEFVRRG